MKIILSLLVINYVLILESCTNESKKERNTVVIDTTKIPAKKIDLKPYFIFNEIEHYYINISEDKVYNPDSIEATSSKKVKRKLEILTNLYSPKSLSDSSVFQNMEDLGFNKKIIPYNSFEKINNIFCKKENSLKQSLACAPIFRDILIFKNHNKIVGIAKICFSCKQNWIIGSLYDTKEFGQYEDYEQLYEILHK